jgi:NAD(P)-dependent dehydrogenase (short-subunit alcohol dehydrogenase family)
MPDVAVVTGASGALGAEVARELARRGHKLALLDTARAREKLEALASSIPGTCPMVADVTKGGDWEQVLARAGRELGGPPLAAALIAGGWRGGRRLHEETSDETWSAMMSSNLETVHRSLRALVPAMVASKRGSIVVVGSRVVEQPASSARAAAYGASKAAVVALAKAVAAEVLEDGVRVNAILPSTMDTPANRAAMPSADPARWVPLRSAAGVIAFLLSDEARDISGAAVPVYGRA